MFLTWQGTRPRFSHNDPKELGYAGTVEDVNFEYDMGAVHRWDHGASRPESCVGHSLTDTDTYKVFRSIQECVTSGFELIGSEFDLPQENEVSRIRYSQTIPDGLSVAIQAASVIAIYDTGWTEQLWVWNKQVPASRAMGAAAGVIRPLEIAVETPEQLDELKALVLEIKESKARA